MNDKPVVPRPLEAFLIIIASFIFVILVTQILVMIFIPDLEDVKQNSIALKMLITFGELGLIIVPLLYVKTRQIPYKKIFRWNAIPNPLIAWSFVIGLSISVLGDELDRIVNIFIPAPEMLQEITAALQINSSSDFILLFFGAVIAASFIEESIIRGFLQVSLEKHQDVTKAVIYASLAWTIIHGMLYWAIQIFLLGIVLGLLAWRANSIVPSLIGHATNNTAALLFYNINQKDLSGIYLWGNHVSPIILVVAILGLVQGVKMFYKYYENPLNRPPGFS